MTRLLRCLISLIVLLAFGLRTSAQAPDFSLSPASGCAPLGVTFTELTGATNPSWVLGSGGAVSGSTVQKTFTTPGVYTISLTANGTTVSKTLTVYGPPTISFTAASPGGCAPFTANFTATGVANAPGGIAYEWYFGDGLSTTGATVDHVYTSPGSYTVILKAKNSADCQAQDINKPNYITAYDNPHAVVTSDSTTLCGSLPGTVKFTNASYGGKGPYTAEWDFGDNGTSKSNTPSHPYTASGYYTVKMYVTDANGCKDTSVNVNYIGVIGQSATFTAPVRACENELITFTNTTTGPVSETVWTFGDNSPAGIGAVATYAYLAAGTYTVNMETRVAGCLKKAQPRTIIVNPNPSVTLSQNPAIPCPAPVPITFTATTTRPGFSVSTYTWSTTNGTKMTTGGVLTDTFKTNGKHEIKLFLKSTDGCQDSAIIDTVKVQNLIVNVTPGIFCPGIDTVFGCDPLSVTFGADLYTTNYADGSQCPYMQYPASIVTYKYNFGDNSPVDNRAAPTHTFSPSGNYRVVGVVTTSNGCIDSSYRPVHVDTPSRPDFYATPLVICPKEPVTIYNTTAKPLPGTKYIIYVGADTVIGSNNLGPYTVRIKAPGTYEVRMMTNHFGCMDTLTRQNYIAVHPPGAKFTDSAFCYPILGVQFTNKSDSATSYRWFFGDGGEDTATHPRHFYQAPGDYTVTLVAYNSKYNCTDTFRHDVFIIKPDISFTANDTTVCKNDLVRFKAATATKHPVFYSWDIDNVRSSPDTTSSYEWTFNSTGYHTVSLYAQSGNSCTDLVTRRNYVLVSGPAVNFDATEHVGCEPFLVQFNDRSTNVPGMPVKRKIWVLGNGDSIKINLTNTPSYTYPMRGIYSVKLYVTDTLNCADSMIRNQYIEVYKPTAVFTQSTDVVCANVPVRFRNFSIGKAPLKYFWDYGDNTSSSTDTTHAYVKSGKYRVRLIVQDSAGCRDTMISPNEIVVNAPSAAFTMSDSVIVCPQGIPVRFTNTSSPDATAFYWDFGDGSRSQQENPVNPYAAAGVYNVYLVAIDANKCTDTARRQIRKLGYAGAMSYTPTLGCAPLEVSFSTPVADIPRLIWDFGDGSKFDTTYKSGPTRHTYTQASATPYIPRVIFDDMKGCNSASEGTTPIQVDKLTADFTWTVPCEGVDFTLTDASTSFFVPANDFAWTLNGTTATGSTTRTSYPQSGTYPVTLTSRSSAGCTATITKDVYINPSPDLNAMADTAICPADTAHLRASNAVSYTWSPSPANPAAWLSCTDCRDPFAFAGGAAVYLVTATDANGCIGHDSTRVVIQIRTTSSTGNGGEICLGESFRLDASGAQKYEWFPAESVDDPYSPTPLATPKTTTTYIVAAQEGSCLVDSQRVTVVVHAAPDFTAGPDKIITLGSATTLEARGSFSKITWLYNDTTLSCLDCSTPNAHPHYTRTYTATAENEWGCKATDSVTVVVRCNGSQIFLPNTFTPNGDDQNDYFYPQGTGFDRLIAFRIYNRWGEVMFETHNTLVNDERAGWDGSYKGKQMLPDTYIYTITGRCPTGELVEFKGDVSIIR